MFYRTNSTCKRFVEKFFRDSSIFEILHKAFQSTHSILSDFLRRVPMPMDGIYTTSVSEETIDEAPMAYKPIDEIVECIGETVDILAILKPIYNFKASE